MKLLCQKHFLREVKKRYADIMIIGKLKNGSDKNCNGFHCKAKPMWIVKYFGEEVSVQSSKGKKEDKDIVK